MQLKRWESPRRQGRNRKGKGGAARQRQLKKQHKLWCKKLKQNTKANNEEGKDSNPSLFRYGILCPDDASQECLQALNQNDGFQSGRCLL